MKYTAAAVALVLLVGAGILGPVPPTGADNRQDLLVGGCVSPSQWHDALGVYTQCWNVTVTLRYGSEVYDTWSGHTCQAGLFQPAVHQDPTRSGAILEVTVNGGFVYCSHTLQVKLDPPQPGSDAVPPVDLGTLIMQRHC